MNARTNKSQSVQTKAVASNIVQKKSNSTGLPDNLKSGIETLSGHSMDDVKVHYNSGRPAQLQAHAFAQGNQIHLAPGQEKHLPHEAWHVVQQKQGRVRPTMQLKSSVPINDDPGLEKEADVMGAKAVSGGTSEAFQLKKNTISSSVAQLNSVLKHEYRSLENPAYTVAKHLAFVTGTPVGAVMNDIAGGVPTSPSLDRPDRVVALLNHATGSGGRLPIITEVGHLGNFEELLRNRGRGNYDGGHLLALELYNNWSKINTPSNLAPQRRNDNRWRGGWRQAEVKLNRNVPVIYEASVSYPDRSYTVNALDMARVLNHPSPTSIALGNASAIWKHLPWTVHTWTPSQFHLSVTSVSSESPTNTQTTLGPDPTNWMPILHRVASPLKGLLTRLIPMANLAEHQQWPSIFGGIDIRSQGNHPVGDSLNEIKQVAIDIAKLTATIHFSGKGVAVLNTVGPYLIPIMRWLPGMSKILALAPILNGTPLAAIMVYAVMHQFNVSRLIPEVPILNWVKYLLNLVGL